MEWFKRLIELLFNKNKTKLIEAPQTINVRTNGKDTFIMNLRQQADLECDDGNGYKIIPHIRLKDMV